MKWVGDAYKYAFEDLTQEEKFCAGMCESMIVYGDELGGCSDKRYLTKYRESLGNKRVNEIYNTLKEFIEEKCQIVNNVSTDSEGISYSGLAWK